MTGSARAASTSASASRASSASAAAWRSPSPPSVVSAWATSSSPRPSPTSGTSRASRRASGYLLDMAPKDLEKVIYFAAYMVISVDEEARHRDLADAGEQHPSRAEDARRPPRLAHRHAPPEARGGARRARGGGRQGRPEEEGQGRRREGHGGHPQVLRRPDHPTREGVGGLPHPRGRRPQGRGRDLPRAPGPLRSVLRGLHGRGVDQASPRGVRPRGRVRQPAPADLRGQGPAQDPRDQAPEGRQLVPADRHEPGIHGARRRPGDPAGAAPDGAAGRWPLRDLRPERPVPPRDQPQQPPPSPDRPRCPRDHRQQREADAAGGRRRAVRQRPPRSSRHRHRQPRAQVA